MNRVQALAQLGLADGAYKPIVIDRAYLRALRGPRKDTQIALKSPGNGTSEQSNDSKTKNLTPTTDYPLGPYQDDIWDSLYWDWVYLPDLNRGDLDGLSTRELCALRREYILEARANEFQLAIERDYPNRTRFSWYDASLFDDIEMLEYVGYNKASLIGDVFSPMAFTAELARDRTQALFVDPSLIWIEGTEVERNEDGAIRPRLDDIAYHALSYVSSLYGGCGFANAMRLIILRLALAFDDECKILGTTYDSFELSLELINHAAKDIFSSQKREGLPLSKCNNWSFRVPCGVTTSALRRAILGDKSILRDVFSDADELNAAIAEKTSSGAAKGDTANLVRAIRDLDGDILAGPTVKEKSYSPIDEAYNCLMQSPECMTREMVIQKRADFMADYRTYKAATKRHANVYASWKYRTMNGLLSRLWEDIKLLFMCLFGSIFLSIPISFASKLLGSIYFNQTMRSGTEIIDLRVVALSIPVGLILFPLILQSWQISLWWDKKLEKMDHPWNLLLDPPVIVLLLRSMLIGTGVGFLICLIASSFIPDLSLSTFRIPLACSAIAPLLLLLNRAAPTIFNSPPISSKPDEQAVRSAWEERIADHITEKYPSLKVVTNDRSVIRSEKSFFRHLEIDIWIPELSLAIEANGEKYHDHRAYDQDVRNHTTRSREMYKERFCERRGIKLLHVWDSESTERIYQRIDEEIDARIYGRRN